MWFLQECAESLQSSSHSGNSVKMFGVCEVWPSSTCLNSFPNNNLHDLHDHYITFNYCVNKTTSPGIWTHTRRNHYHTNNNNQYRHTLSLTEQKQKKNTWNISFISVWCALHRWFLMIRHLVSWRLCYCMFRTRRICPGRTQKDKLMFLSPKKLPLKMKGKNTNPAEPGE